MRMAPIREGRARGHPPRPVLIPLAPGVRRRYAASGMTGSTSERMRSGWPAAPVIRSELDEGAYPTGCRITDEQMSALAVKRDSFHGEWNYSLLPEAHN